MSRVSPSDVGRAHFIAFSLSSHGNEKMQAFWFLFGFLGGGIYVLNAHSTYILHSCVHGTNGSERAKLASGFTWENDSFFIF